MANRAGLQEFQRHRYERALDEFQQAARLDPENAEYHNNIGMARLRLGKIELAYYDFARAERLRPNQALYAFNAGLTLRQAGKAAEAEGAFRRALIIDPDHYGAQDAMALIHLEAGRLGEARRAWEKTAEIKATPDVLANLARTHLALEASRTDANGKDLMRARQYLDQALTLDAKHAGSHYALGLWHETREDWTAALAAYQEALEINPALLEAQFKQAVAHEQLGQPAAAIAALETFIRSAPPKTHMTQIIAARNQIRRIQQATPED